MTAYHHSIHFIPPLEHKNMSGSHENVITIQESNIDIIKYKKNHTMNFINNQGREVALYTDSVENKVWFFEVKEVITFFWQSSSLTLDYIKHEKFSKNLLLYWSLHTVLPLFFTLENTYDFLHAGAVEIEGKSVLFTAESFGGKSTMTDFFMKKDHTLLSDDKVGTFEKEGTFYAVPSHPNHRPHRGVEDLGFHVNNMADKPSKIHAIYTLEKAPHNSKVRIVELRGIEKFKSLKYASELNINFQKAKRFKYLMKMTNTVSVYKITVPWDLERLDEVYKAITSHSRSL